MIATPRVHECMIAPSAHLCPNAIGHVARPLAEVLLLAAPPRHAPVAAFHILSPLPLIGIAVGIAHRAEAALHIMLPMACNEEDFIRAHRNASATN